MKIIFAVAAVVAVSMAEPPPSNSYLPPSPASRSQGYSSGRPEVVAARNLNQGRNGIGGFARNGGQGLAKFSVEAEGYDRSSVAITRNALEEINAEPANYNFGYMVNDNLEGTKFGHHEQRHEERAEGQYHVVLPDGRKQTVNYEADESGFKPHISYQESEGYDSNASSGNFRSGLNGASNHGNGYDAAGNGYNGNNNRNGYRGGSIIGNGYDGASGRGNGYDGAGNHGNGGANGRFNYN